MKSKVCAFLVLICFPFLCIRSYSQNNRLPSPPPPKIPQHFYYPNSKPEKIRQKFQVTMKDSTVKEVDGTILSQSGIHYLEWEDSNYKKRDSERNKIIYPSQTLFVVKVEDTYKPSAITTESGWLFKICEGKITAYSYLPEEIAKDSSIAFIQKENGLLIEMTQGNIEEMTKDNGEALHFVVKKKYLKAIRKYNEDE